MKKFLLLATALGISGVGLAQELGRVLSSTPVIQQIGVPRQVCNTEQVPVDQPKTGAGAAMGAIAGGALANAASHGSGQAAVTLIGILGGAIVGDRIESPAAAQLQNVQRCSTQTSYENRTVAYNVVYEYAGKQYAVQLPQDPGPTIALQVSPVGASAPPASSTQLQQAPVTYSQPAQVIVTQPYYPQAWYPPVSMELDLGYYGGYRGHRHWLWR